MRSLIGFSGTDGAEDVGAGEADATGGGAGGAMTGSGAVPPQAAMAKANTVCAEALPRFMARHGRPGIATLQQVPRVGAPPPLDTWPDAKGTILTERAKR